MDRLAFVAVTLVLLSGRASSLNTFSPFALWLRDCLAGSKPEYAGSQCSDHLTSMLNFVGATLAPPYSFTADHLEGVQNACKARPCLDITGDAFEEYTQQLNPQEGTCATFPLAMSNPSTGLPKGMFDFLCLGGDARCLVSIASELKKVKLLKAFTSMYFGGDLNVADENALCEGLARTKCCFRTWVHLSYAILKQSCRNEAAEKMMSILTTCTDLGFDVQGVCSGWSQMPHQWLRNRTDCPEILMNSTWACTDAQKEATQCFQNTCDIWCALNFGGQKDIPLPWETSRTTQEYIGRVLLITCSVGLVLMFISFLVVRFLLKREKKMLEMTDSEVSETEVLSVASSMYSSKTSKGSKSSKFSRSWKLEFDAPEPGKDKLSERASIEDEQMGNALEYYAKSFTAQRKRPPLGKSTLATEMSNFSINVGHQATEEGSQVSDSDGNESEKNGLNEAGHQDEGDDAGGQNTLGGDRKGSDGNSQSWGDYTSPDR